MGRPRQVVCIRGHKMRGKNIGIEDRPLSDMQNRKSRKRRFCRACRNLRTRKKGLRYNVVNGLLTAITGLRTAMPKRLKAVANGASVVKAVERAKRYIGGDRVPWRVL